MTDGRRFGKRVSSCPPPGSPPPLECSEHPPGRTPRPLPGWSPFRVPVPVNGVGAPRLGSFLCWRPIPNFAENFPSEAQIAVDLPTRRPADAPPPLVARRSCQRPGSGSVNSSSTRAPVTCLLLLAPTWRFALEPCRPGVQTRWADLSHSSENLGSKERERVAHLLSQPQPV